MTKALKQLVLLRLKHKRYKLLLDKKILGQSRGLRKKIKLVNLLRNLEKVQNLMNYIKSPNIEFLNQVNSKLLEELLNKMENSISQDSCDSQIDESFYQIYSHELFEKGRLMSLMDDYKKCVFILALKKHLQEQHLQSGLTKLMQNVFNLVENVKFQIDVLAVIILDLFLFYQSPMLIQDMQNFFELVWKVSFEINESDKESFEEISNLLGVDLASIQIKRTSPNLLRKTIKILIGYEEEAESKEEEEEEESSNLIFVCEENVGKALELVSQCIIGTHLKSDKFLLSFEEVKQSFWEEPAKRSERESISSKDSFSTEMESRLLVRILGKLKRMECENQFLIKVLDFYFERLEILLRESNKFQSFEQFFKLEGIVIRNYEMLKDLFLMLEGEQGESSSIQSLIKKPFLDGLVFIQKMFNIKLLYSILRKMDEMDFFDFEICFNFHEEIRNRIRFVNLKSNNEKWKIKMKKNSEPILLNMFTKLCLDYLYQTLIYSRLTENNILKM